MWDQKKQTNSCTQSRSHKTEPGSKTTGKAPLESRPDRNGKWRPIRRGWVNGNWLINEEKKVLPHHKKKKKWCYGIKDIQEKKK